MYQRTYEEALSKLFPWGVFLKSHLEARRSNHLVDVNVTQCGIENYFAQRGSSPGPFPFFLFLLRSSTQNIPLSKFHILTWCKAIASIRFCTRELPKPFKSPCHCLNHYHIQISLVCLSVMTLSRYKLLFFWVQPTNPRSSGLLGSCYISRPVFRVCSFLKQLIFRDHLRHLHPETSVIIVLNILLKIAIYKRNCWPRKNWSTALQQNYSQQDKRMWGPANTFVVWDPRV